MWRTSQLRAEVVETVQKGEFRVYAVETIDEGVEVLPVSQRARQGQTEVT
jgi:predicted ATP-dependent protease